MPDYFRADHLAAKLSIEVDELHRFEEQGMIRKVLKGGNAFYSSRDYYTLKGMLHFMRNEGLSMKAARARIAQSAGSANASAH